jgi:hypothetical protein
MTLEAVFLALERYARMEHGDEKAILELVERCRTAQAAAKETQNVANAARKAAEQAQRDANVAYDACRKVRDELLAVITNDDPDAQLPVFLGRNFIGAA